ncbi:hypothetical protein [Flavobacterium glaciei]|uniref:Lipoprotein n=1 Tax=Flavobacterium glaciei TaxID=386300 RepID=A0A562PJR4_9FLAO|nr:hypothetical protein [Flavobacterium glaciei]RDI50437.1 hypothetical protein DFR66_1167 [Flavobacterium glaciei]TWI44691.1 hypothetical protein IQ02_02466 [Flavobacterium glaciei]
MKKVILLSAIFISVLVSCKNEKEMEKVPVSLDEIDLKLVSEECYSAIIKKDTISMSLNLKGSQVVSGNLSYKFFEKDKNEGSLVGVIKQDTLFAEYTFMSEGVSSVRQIVFLKQGNTYVEGYGDVVADDKGKVTFKDKKQLKFDGNVVLTKVACKI